MSTPSNRRRSARRLRFENLESRWLLTALTGSHESVLPQTDPATDIVPAQERLVSAPADSRTTVALPNAVRFDPLSDAEGESSDVPTLVSPLQDDVVEGTSVTLEFEPLPGYTGDYLVRLDDANWDGRQASGFQHDSNLHYLSITTKSTRITLPVEAGKNYRWWVHKLRFPAARASFSVAEDNTPPAPSPDVPILVSPLQDDVIEGTSVTLEFEPLPGYTGNYLVRLSDANWDGRQATGFQHDSSIHYLSITTKSTRITLPVEAGEHYRWWVHKPGFPAVDASFSVAEDNTPPAPSPDVPILVSPLQDDVIEGTSVTLEFEPLPGYTGNYLVRLSDANWDGRQATGFQHDSSIHYLSITTKSTRITLPVEAGEHYRWWVHKPGFPAVDASFSVAEDNTPPAPSPDVPILVSPLQDDVIVGASVTLEFEPLPGYTGTYQVRLDDANWDGRQASGFQHDSKLHYLSITTKSTRITLPVEVGETYRWWVHKPGFPAVDASFSVAEDNTPPAPSPDVPILVSPLQDDVIVGASVTLEFEPLPGYTGTYQVRLDDANWDGRQASGFQHDSKLHYLSITTKSTRITLPVEVGETYRWWVHKRGFPAARATFSTSDLEIYDAELIDGRYRCTALEPWNGTTVDVSPILQHCIDQVPLGATLELPVGEYRLSHQVQVNRRIVLTSVGKSLDDPALNPGDGDAAQLTANPDLNEPFGLLYLNGIKTMHHIILDGSKANRFGTAAYHRVVDEGIARYGFNALLESDDAELVGNVFQNALAGSGLGVKGSRDNVVIRNNKFLDNGTHNRQNLWADGLTVHDVSNSQIVGNEFRNNTDIDLIFGGAQDSVIRDNTIVHTADPAGGAFAGLMIHKWSNSSGDYSGSDISGNVVDGGPNRTIGSGIYVASEGWYNETPYGRTTSNPVRATIHDNVARNVQNGMYIAARGFSIYENQFA